MGLFDKFKDLFTDEEEVYETKEIEIEEKEEEHKLPTFMRNKIEKEEQELKILEDSKKDEKEVAVLVENPQKKEQNKFPFDFDDDDFIEPTRFSRSVVQKEKVLEKQKESQVVTPTIKPYSNKKELEKPKKFRPTPVISPVYGVLDKNYRKEEVISKNEDSYEMQRPSKKVDFDSVRKKAYGSLSDDISANMMCENCELLKEIKVNKKIEKLTEEDLLYNMTTDEDVLEKEEASQMDKDITVGEASENYDDYGVEYEVPPQREQRRKEEVKIVNHAEKEVVVEKVEVKEEQNKLADSKNKDLELTDDLFNLIDSMYKERND